MNSLFPEHFLIESDIRIRQLERQLEQGNVDSGIKLLAYHRRAGSGDLVQARILSKLVGIDPEIIEHISNLIPISFVELSKLANMMRLGTIKLDANQLEFFDPDNPRKSIGLLFRQFQSNASLSDLEPYLPIIASDSALAIAAPLRFKFLWEELDNYEGLVELAKKNIGISAHNAVRYFDHFSNLYRTSNRSQWPWKFNDSLGHQVLMNIASKPSTAFAYAKISHRLNRSIDPWPESTSAGRKALVNIAKQPEYLLMYEKMTGKPLITSNIPEISRAAERTIQKYNI